MGEDRPREDRRRRYELVLGLWQAENPIKTLKLQALLLTNALVLPSYIGYRGEGGALLVALFMFLADLVWVFSLGRTVGYQKLRRGQLEKIRGEDPDDPLLSVHSPERGKLPLWGSLPASTYLVGAPVGLAALWALLAAWAVASLDQKL